MKITNSYKCKIIEANKMFEPTINIYRKSLEYLVDVIAKEWNGIKDLQAKEKNNFVESLVHKTKYNPHPKYDFDSKFYKFPSYFRRGAIQHSIGIVSSYFSNLENYKNERYKAISNGEKFRKKPPKLNVKHFKNPIFYKGNMFNKFDKNEVLIKLFINNDWVWKSIKLRNQDIKYIEKNCYLLKESSPGLVKKGRVYYLEFAYESKVSLSKENALNQTIVSVDLGLNHSAVCSAINSKGTVIDRIFINQSVEKDRMNRLLNRSKLKRKQSGKVKMPKLWNKINNLNMQIVNDTVSKIIKFALKNKATVIVMEYLDFKGKKPKNIALKLQMWAKRAIQQKILHKAHSNGMRFSRVSARNTSLLAFDGIGKVSRSSKNFSNCKFSNGKQYNCDLNASYNIGARYFIREYEKTISVKKWLQLQANVPEVVRRTQCTLSTLINLVAVL